MAEENRPYAHLMANDKADLYDTLTLHREQLDQLETLISQVKNELSNTPKYEFHTAKSLLDIAEYLSNNFIDFTQKQIDKIESLAPTATGKKQ